MKTSFNKEQRMELLERLIEELQDIQKAAPEDGEVLRALYDGELYPAEMGFSHIFGYKALARKASETSSEVFRLTEQLPEVREAFNAYCDAKGEIGSVENYELFARGFGLGIRLVLAGLGKA